MKYAFEISDVRGDYSRDCDELTADLSQVLRMCRGRDLGEGRHLAQPN
jgi:hypothetical protein